SLGEAENHLRRRPARCLALQEHELDVAGEASLQVATFEVFDLEREPEGLRVEAVGAREVRYDEDDGEVLELGVEHGIPFARVRPPTRGASETLPGVAVRPPGVSASAKISPWPSGSLAANTRGPSPAPTSAAASRGSSSTWLRRSRQSAGVRRGSGN